MDIELAKLQLAAMVAQKAAQIAQKALQDNGFLKQQAKMQEVITKLQADIATAEKE